MLPALQFILDIQWNTNSSTKKPLLALLHMIKILFYPLMGINLESVKTTYTIEGCSQIFQRPQVF